MGVAVFECLNIDVWCALRICHPGQRRSGTFRGSVAYRVSSYFEDHLITQADGIYRYPGFRLLSKTTWLPNFPMAAHLLHEALRTQRSLVSLL